MAANPNREIYNSGYTPAQLDISLSTAWDRYLVELRMELIRRYGTGKDVLDLCCGTGSYLLPNLDRFRSAVAVDFSRTMLDALRARLGGTVPAKLIVVEEDVQELSAPGESVDFVWSYTSLYNVPALDRTLGHVARVLRRGGYAALELGNSHSLNELVSRQQHRDAGASRLYSRPYGELRRLVADAGFVCVEWRAFQLLTMYGTPRRLRLLAPLFSARWKTVLGRRVRGRIVDEWISGAWPLRRVAFRHLVVVRKP
jgi:ubiquinone/menaquinone biosynthesis C-methylase UbiE